MGNTCSDIRSVPPNIYCSLVSFPSPFALIVGVCVWPPLQLCVRVEREQEEAPQHGEGGPRELRRSGPGAAPLGGLCGGAAELGHCSLRCLRL